MYIYVYICNQQISHNSVFIQYKYKISLSMDIDILIYVLCIYIYYSRCMQIYADVCGYTWLFIYLDV